MDYKQKLEYQSNYWYNDGLKKAQIRDLSGAIVSLKRSLQFNRENITARNLLGLVYYGRGEVAREPHKFVFMGFFSIFICQKVIPDFSDE